MLAVPLANLQESCHKKESLMACESGWERRERKRQRQLTFVLVGTAEKKGGGEGSSIRPKCKLAFRANAEKSNGKGGGGKKNGRGKDCGQRGGFWAAGFSYSARYPLENGRGGKEGRKEKKRGNGLSTCP